MKKALLIFVLVLFIFSGSTIFQNLLPDTSDKVLAASEISEVDFLKLLIEYFDPDSLKEIDSTSLEKNVCHMASEYSLPILGVNRSELANNGITRGRAAMLIATAITGKMMTEPNAINFLYENNIARGGNEENKDYESFNPQQSLKVEEANIFLQRLSNAGYPKNSGIKHVKGENFFLEQVRPLFERHGLYGRDVGGWYSGGSFQIDSSSNEKVIDYYSKSENYMTYHIREIHLHKLDNELYYQLIKDMLPLLDKNFPIELANVIENIKKAKNSNEEIKVYYPLNEYGLEGKVTFQYIGSEIIITWGYPPEGLLSKEEHWALDDKVIETLKIENGKLKGFLPQLPDGFYYSLIFTGIDHLGNSHQHFLFEKEGESFEVDISNDQFAALSIAVYNELIHAFMGSSGVRFPYGEVWRDGEKVRELNLGKHNLIDANLPPGYLSLEEHRELDDRVIETITIEDGILKGIIPIFPEKYYYSLEYNGGDKEDYQPIKIELSFNQGGNFELDVSDYISSSLTIKLVDKETESSRGYSTYNFYSEQVYRYWGPVYSLEQLQN